MGQRPVIFSTLTSQHALRDRSLSAWCYHSDRISCEMIWLDTQTHIDWFAQEFGAPATKVAG